jgi:penicillin G amidase
MLKPISRTCELLLAGLLFLCLISTCWAVDATVRTVKVAGLKQPAQILVDRWGVPHIYAENQEDLFFVQGFNAARDRLFQIDLWRRRGLGELASVFGPAYVEQDRAARLFLYRGNMRDEWRAYGKDAQSVATSFVAGINAYIDYVRRNPQQLPFEFRLLGYVPARWQPEDVVRIRSHGLTRNLTLEVARAHVVCKAGLAADEIRAGLSPAWTTRVPDGLDPCLPDDVLRDFVLATQNVFFAPQALLNAQADIDTGEESREGSNNWVVAPSRSATGRAILANDPHRAYTTPSLRYIAHLSAPGLDVIGAGEPALPGISIGHNEHIAFGLTIFSIDQEDLYVYEIDPSNPLRYRYKNGWEKFKVIKEQIAVRGQPPVTVDLMFTRHGPVIYREPEKRRAFAVRTGWMAAGMAPYFGSIEYMRARNFEQFRDAMRRWGAPTENQIYADTEGNIGWVAGGLAPQRPNWDGLLPVPGDGRYEWAGFLPGAKLPFSYNPKQGWFATANELNLPEGYPYREYKLGFEWPHDARAVRIGEVLSANAKMSIDDMLRLQNDAVSVPARRIVAMLKPLSAREPNAQAALRLLGNWDAVETADSAAAALFEVWWSRHLVNDFKAALLGTEAAATMTAPDTTVMLDTLEKPAGRFGLDAENKRNRLLLASLANAWADMEKLQGPDPKAWQWGRLQFSYFVHPLAPLVNAETRARINIGPFPRQGSAYTINQSSYRATDFLHYNGPSVRMVIDVGGWDNSRAVNTPGQSGDPADPHYRDLAASWASGRYFPLLYSRKAVEDAVTERIKLEPAR